MNAALDTWKQALPPNHPFVVYALCTKLAIYTKLKAFPQAESFLREGIDVSKRVFPPGHPLARNMFEHYAYVLEKLNRKEEASRARAESEVLLAFPRAPRDLAHK